MGISWNVIYVVAVTGASCPDATDADSRQLIVMRLEYLMDI